MSGLLTRLRRLIGAEAHGAVARLEDPVRLAEAGVRDLKANLSEAVSSLARVKAVAIRLRREAEHERERALGYERKAAALVKLGLGGKNEAETDRLAAAALRLKGEAEAWHAELAERAAQQEGLAAQLQNRTEALRRTVSSYEDDLVTLRARATSARSVRRINEHLAGLEVSDTVALLEEMRGRVAEEEALAEAYGQLHEPAKTLEREIDDALAGGSAAHLQAQRSLAELKRQLASSDAG